MKVLVIILGVIVIAVGAGAMVWLAGDEGAETTRQASQNQEKTTGEEVTKEQDVSEDVAAVTVTYTDDGFNASKNTVEAGSTILVTNKSSKTLQFSSDPHPQHTDNSELNLPLLRPGEEETMVVNDSGTWGYHNHLNDDHSGSITITD